MPITISQISPQTIPDIAGVPARTLQGDETATLTGRNATVILSTEGDYHLLLHRLPVLRALTVTNAPALAARQNPVYVERELNGALRERVFVPIKHAAAAWHWTAARRCELSVQLEWASRANAEAVASTVLLCDRAVRWASDGNSARLTAQLDADQALTMVIADVTADRDGKSLRPFDNLAALVKSRVADWNRAQEELITVSSSASGWADRVNAALYALYAAGIDFETLRAAPHTTVIGLEDATQTVAQLLHTLGFAPDAEKHRLVLAPRLPAEWTRLEVRRLPLNGSDTIALRYARSAAEHRFVLTPETGAVPPRLVFEPSIPARNISVVTVDGVRADLDFRRSGGRIICPLQVVLDHARTIVLVADELAAS